MIRSFPNIQEWSSALLCGCHDIIRQVWRHPSPHGSLSLSIFPDIIRRFCLLHFYVYCAGYHPAFLVPQNSVSGLGRLGRLAKFGLKFKKILFFAFQNLHIPKYFCIFVADLGINLFFELSRMSSDIVPRLSHLSDLKQGQNRRRKQGIVGES